MRNFQEQIKPRDTLLDIQDLKTYFRTEYGLVKAVDGASLTIKKGKALGVVGESGCGKSVTALSIMQLISPPGKIVDGHIYYYKSDNGPIDIVPLLPNGAKMRGIRGKEISMIFQEPMTSLNPLYTIGEQIVESLLVDNMTREQARKNAIKMLDLVGIPSPEQRVDEYPHQLSGGMRQRAMIAMALCRYPKLLIADEPTTALDVTLQAQILILMRELQEELGMSIMIITHDLGVVAEIADEVVVMYMGKDVEFGTVRQIFQNPRHPYTIGLLNSIPIIGPEIKKWLEPIQGLPPSPYELPEGCYFGPRCSYATPQCKIEPHKVEIETNHYVKCWLYTQDGKETGDAP